VEAPRPPKISIDGYRFLKIRKWHGAGVPSSITVCHARSTLNTTKKRLDLQVM